MQLKKNDFIGFDKWAYRIVKSNLHTDKML